MPISGFISGYVIDKFGPRRMMMTGIVMAGGALIGLSLMSGVLWVFYLCYLFNALGYAAAWSVAQSGPVVALVRPLAGQGHGFRLCRHRDRGRDLLFLFLADQSWAVIVFAILLGLGLGGEYMIIPLVVAELTSVRVMGRIMGIILTADGVAEAVTPMLVAHLRDTTGSYNAGVVLLIALSFLGLLAILLLPRKIQQSASASAPN